ncbi:MAG: hypothetical protein ACYTG6_17250 [Planctomycetota bacterium]|jgi:rubrerythrin
MNRRATNRESQRLREDLIRQERRHLRFLVKLKMRMSDVQRGQPIGMAAAIQKTVHPAA